MRTAIGFIFLGAVILFAVLGPSMRQKSRGEEYRLEARELIKQVEGYSQRPDYYDWLVDAAHEDILDKVYVRERSGGRRSRDNSYVDSERYYYELFMWMMRQAAADKATQVSINLQKFRDENLADPDGRRPARPR